MEPGVTTFYTDDSVTLHLGDALDVARDLSDGSVDCVVTSPPYFGLRDYGEPGQYGLEESPGEYVETMRLLFTELRRVLADDGTLWLNLGDSYSTRPRGSDNGWDKSRLSNPAQVQKMQRAAMRDRDFDRSPKNLLGIPWRVAFVLQDEGWILRNDIIWSKPNAMPESIRDRLSARHEHLFLFAKSPRYWFDLDPIREPLLHPDLADGSRVFGGRNKGSAGGVDSTSRRRGDNAWTPRADPTPYPDMPPQNLKAATGSQHTGGNPAGRNPGDVWTITTQPFPGAHFATMPVALAERCIQAGCKPGGVVLDPFSGSGTTGLAAARHGRRYVGIDLSSDYLDLSLRTRLAAATLDFGTESA